VENTAGTDRCEATLTVVGESKKSNMVYPTTFLESLEKKEEQKAPEFIIKLADKSANPKEKVTLECKVVGQPTPEVNI
jgi:hypothetical protein